MKNNKAMEFHNELKEIVGAYIDDLKDTKAKNIEAQRKSRYLDGCIDTLDNVIEYLEKSIIYSSELIEQNKEEAKC